MELLFKIAKSLGAESIQAYTYKGERVFEIKNGFYNNKGDLLFSRIPSSDFIVQYQPKIDGKDLKKSIGTWIFKAGKFISLRIK